MSGLAGTGKSFFCHMLAERPPFLIPGSATLRKILFAVPRYDEHDNKRLFSACHVLIEDLLSKGTLVIFDATNLLEHHRGYLYRAARRSKARLILVWAEAPPEVVQQRPVAREKSAIPQHHSEAGWDVYSRMRPRTEKICRNHLVFDTSQHITAAVDKIAQATSR